MDLWAIKAAGAAQAVTLLFKSPRVIVAWCSATQSVCYLESFFVVVVVLFFETEKMKPKLKPTSLLLQGEEQPAGLEKFSDKKKNAARRHKTSKRQLWRRRRPRFGDTTGVRRCQAPNVQTSKENMEIPADGGGTGNETIYIQESSRPKR